MKRLRSRSLLFLATPLLCFACDAGVTPGTGGGGASSGTKSTTGGFTNSSSTGFAAGGAGGEGPKGDPKTCAQAEMYKTYLGCDFYPTVLANNVWDIFDYAVVVANAGDTAADVTVDGGGLGAPKTTTIPPNGAASVFLPWVSALKGQQANACGAATPLPATVRAPGGAFHLTSTVPVTVYQFSALEYAPQGGPPGKDWSACPGKDCIDPVFGFPAPVPCFSFSNDASLLLPSTALTNNYRVTGYPGWPDVGLGATLSITGTADGTSVTVSLGTKGAVVAGGGIGQIGASGQGTFTINKGEVVELVGTPSGDFSGTLVQSDKPIQVIHGLPCTQVPYGKQACDHVEESVLPAETLGKHYVVTMPTGPLGDPVKQLIRLVGNVNGTTLTYPSGKPSGAPDTLNAGQLVDMDVTDAEFEVVGDHEFAVSTFQTGAELSNPDAPVGMQAGDPAQSMATAVEQYRLKYVFLAPTDYTSNFIDVVAPTGATITVDGIAITKAASPIGSSSFGVVRLKLGAGTNGAHILEASAPVGLQVLGYGNYTSYQYPGGLNLDVIAPPPPPPQ